MMDLDQVVDAAENFGKCADVAWFEVRSILLDALHDEGQDGCGRA